MSTMGALRVQTPPAVARHAVSPHSAPRRSQPMMAGQRDGCVRRRCHAALTVPLKGSDLKCMTLRPRVYGQQGQSAVLNVVKFGTLAAVVGVVGVVATGNMSLLVQTLGGNSSLAALKAGFISAFSCIFVSELGDKTFFIAALLAMRRGRAIVLAGATSALAVMTIVSVAIGMIFHKVPELLSSGHSLPIGQWLGAALLVYFGIRNIQDALAATPEPEEGQDATGELADAEEFVQSAVSTKSGTTAWGALVEAFSLIFVAEWGDRSMLATIALGAAQNPIAVATGAIAAHFAATLIAVVGGAMLSKYISEKVVGITGGVLFLVFAVLTLFGVF